MEEHLNYIHITGINPRDATTMMRYREDAEQFIFLYPWRVAS